jgi:hypothetical protein
VAVFSCIYGGIGFRRRGGRLVGRLEVKRREFGEVAVLRLYVPVLWVAHRIVVRVLVVCEAGCGGDGGCSECDLEFLGRRILNVENESEGVVE